MSVFKRIRPEKFIHGPDRGRAATWTSIYLIYTFNQIYSVAVKLFTFPCLAWAEGEAAKRGTLTGLASSSRLMDSQVIWPRRTGEIPL